MRTKVLTITVLIVFALAATALAVTSSKTLVFDKSPMGKVTFSGKVHADAGFKCVDCHNPDMFAKKQQGATPIKMKDIYAGNLCGKCHNGKVAFKAMGNCGKCHKK